MEKVEIKSDRFDNMVENIKKYGGCPVSATLKIIGGKWKPIILYFISVDVNRFGQLQRMIPDCSKRMMTTQLRELEKDGIIHRKVFAELPPKVIYSLTEKGESLRPIFSELSKWGIKNVLQPKLEKGVFLLPESKGENLPLAWSQLVMIIEGFQLKNMERSPRYTPQNIVKKVS